jgi:AcrR family transcriptional regulator
MDKKRTLTLDKIVAQAVAMADCEGISALSMRKLASSLGVEAASLYNHIADKESLLAQMVESVVAEIPPARPDPDWRGALAAHYLAAHQALMRHNWASHLFISRPNMGPATLTRFESILAVLTGAGFALTEADHAHHLLESLLHGHTLQMLNFPFAPEDYAAQAAANAHLIPVQVFPNLRGLADLVAARRYDGLHPFAPALERLLGALAP